MLERLQRLGAVAAELAQLRGDREALLLETVRAAREVTGAAYSSIGLVEGRYIHWQSAAGKPLEEVRGVKQPLDEGLCGWVVRHGRSRRTGDVAHEADYFLQYEEMQSELDVPLLVGRTVIGVLNVEDPAPGAFTLEDERLLQLLAGYAAMALAGERGSAE
jgi:GAF domain-containing protein